MKYINLHMLVLFGVGVFAYSIKLCNHIRKKPIVPLNEMNVNRPIVPLNDMDVYRPIFILCIGLFLTNKEHLKGHLFNTNAVHKAILVNGITLLAA